MLACDALYICDRSKRVERYALRRGLVLWMRIPADLVLHPRRGEPQPSATDVPSSEDSGPGFHEELRLRRLLQVRSNVTKNP